MLIDAFTYFNEKELVELRLKYLNPIVDHFVIIESNITFTGKEKKSGRDGFIVYMGNEIYGVKWKNWKIHLKEQETAFTEVRTYELPRLYNLLSDPQERDNVILSNSWVPKAAHKLLAEHKRSFAQYPPIKPGTKDPYIPPNTKKN